MSGINCYGILKKIKVYPRNFTHLNVISVCALLFCGFLLIATMTSGKNTGPLLLNSGLTEAREAELRIVLWFELGAPSQDIKGSLPQKGWEWKESQRNVLGTKTYTLTGYKVIEAEEEEQIHPWFQELSLRVKELDGIAYLDERVSEGIDIANYAVQQGINPVQWALSESTLSIAGQKSDLYQTVQAGADSINVQLITQSYEGRSKTGLAIPALLEEF
jgi:hypothetical protein